MSLNKPTSHETTNKYEEHIHHFLHITFILIPDNTPVAFDALYTSPV